MNLPKKSTLYRSISMAFNLIGNSRCKSIEIFGKTKREAIISFTEGDDQRLLLMGLRRFTKWQQPINPKTLRREIADKLLAENKYCF